jgi:hypothetical protein
MPPIPHLFSTEKKPCHYFLGKYFCAQTIGTTLFQPSNLNVLLHKRNGPSEVHIDHYSIAYAVACYPALRK